MRPLTEGAVAIDGYMAMGCYRIIPTTEIEAEFALRKMLDNPPTETFPRNWRYGY